MATLLSQSLYPVFKCRLFVFKVKGLLFSYCGGGNHKDLEVRFPILRLRLAGQAQLGKVLRTWRLKLNLLV